jgi:hypothetical protein
MFFSHSIRYKGLFWSSAFTLTVSDVDKVLVLRSEYWALYARQRLRGSVLSSMNMWR